MLRRHVFTQVELDYIKNKAAGQSLGSSLEVSEEEYSNTSVDISVHDLVFASSAVISATPATSLTEYEQQLFGHVCDYMQRLLTDDLYVMSI